MRPWICKTDGIADYDPQASFRTSDAKLAIGAAVAAIQRFA